MATETEVKRMLENVAEMIVCTEQRALTSATLDQKTWKIWGYTRLNKDTLDSEVHCRGIRKIIESAIADVQRRADDSAIDARKHRQANKELKSINKDLNKEIEKQSEALKKTRSIVDRLQSKVKQLTRQLEPEESNT